MLTPRILNIIEDLAGDLHHLDARIEQVTGRSRLWLAMTRLANA
jgi:hypothetical protein